MQEFILKKKKKNIGISYYYHKVETQHKRPIPTNLIYAYSELNFCVRHSRYMFSVYSFVTVADKSLPTCIQVPTCHSLPTHSQTLCWKHFSGGSFRIPL